MGYSPRHPAGEHVLWFHSRRVCQRCIFDLEVELGFRQYPPPPRLGRGIPREEGTVVS